MIRPTGYLAFPLIALMIGLAVSSCNKEPAKIAVTAITDPVKIDTGYISGTLIGDVGKVVRVYRGIPYAAPPVGDLRWKPPQPAKPWAGIREFTAFSKSCPQPTGPVEEFDMPQSEDCLYLNIQTPAKRTSDNLPVMVNLHGGGYTTGSGNDLLENYPRLPQKDVILITVNMRLGALGLLAHSLLSKESPKGISGNYLFLDVIAALEWIQRNIATFGGNPSNVTIFGESGGGMKVNCLMASPLAKGLFQKGILQSGASGKLTPGVPLIGMEAIGEKFFVRLGVDKADDPLKAARALPPAKILEAQVSLAKEFNTEEYWDSAVDGQFLADIPANIFRAGKQNPVPIITSAVLGELTGPGIIEMPFLIPDYVNILNGVNKTGQKGYACIFDQVPSKWRQEGCVSFHALDLLYVFGVFSDRDIAARFLPTAFFFAKPSGAKSPDPGLTDMDRKVSVNMMTMWTKFARTGNPNVEGLVTWPAYESATDQYLYIAEPLQVKSGFSKVAQK